MENESTSQSGFTQRWLPWIIAAGAFLFYLVYMPRWGTHANLAALAKVNGWDWRLTFHAPLYFLATYPVRWLPATWQLIALNGLSVLWSAIALGLLARCVALLPHDRTKEQRQLERSDFSYLTIATAWLPPLLAVVTCGLQLTLWEHAVTPSGEALDLLLFAFVIWSLLEFRIDEKDWRLFLAACVYGAGMTNNYALIAFLPAFVLAVMWIKGLPFFRARFLLTMVGAGLAGLLFYLVPPVMNAGSGLTHLDFWGILLVNLGYQKTALISFPRYVLLIVGLTSFLPVLFMAIRWPAQVGDISAASIRLTQFMTVVVHAVFLLACLAVAFDPPFGPRALGAGRSLLPLYFLGALSVGYFSGYFLLLTGPRLVRSWERPGPFLKLLHRVVTVLILLLLPVVAVLLFVRNSPQIESRNGRSLELFGQSVLQTLPSGPAYILSDDPIRLRAFQLVLNQSKPDHEYILVESGTMALPGYHRWLHRQHEERWPDTLDNRPLTQLVPDVSIVRFAVDLSQSAPIYYLHPSFGYYFESFYARPTGMIYELSRIPENALTGPAVTDEDLQKQKAFYEKLFQEIPLQKLVKKMAALAPNEYPDLPSLYGAQIFSLLYNNLAIGFQKAGKLEEAKAQFQRALALNPANPCALINERYNDYLRDPAGDPPVPDEEVKKRLQPFGGSWSGIIGLNGMVDEPNTSFLLSQSFIQGANFIQAAQQLKRTLELNPRNFLARLSLASVYIKLNRIQDCFQTLEQIRQNTDLSTIPVSVRMKLIEVEAWAHVASGDVPRAETLLKQAQKDAPDQNEPFSVLANIYLAEGQRPNAVTVYQQQLKQQPDNVGAMINLSAIHIVELNYKDAITLLDKALNLEPKNFGAMINRAIAHLNSGHLIEAQRDYQTLEALSPRPIASAVYGLAEVAWLQKEYKKALLHYEHFLEIALPGTREIPIVRNRIQAIKSGKL